VCHPLMPLLSCSEYYLNAPFAAQLPKQPKSETSFHGVGDPTTYEEKGSDLCRAYLTRLCFVFRLSQPLDALFRLYPFPPCFMRVTSMGFRLQRVSPRGNQYVSSTYPVLLVVSSLCPKAKSRDSKDVSTRAIRAFKTGVTRDLSRRSFHSVVPLRGLNLRRLGSVQSENRQSLLSWASTHR